MAPKRPTLLPPVEEDDDAMAVSSIAPSDTGLVPPAAPPASSSSRRQNVNRAVSCEPCRKSKLKCEKIFPCLRCVRLGLTCDNPQANAEEERLAQQLSMRHGWGRVLQDPAQLTVEQRTEIARSRPRSIHKEKARLVLQSMAQVQHVYGFQHMLPMLQKWAAGLKVDLAACRVPQPPRGELHLPSYMAAPLDEASAQDVLHPFLLRPFGGEAFLSFGAVYRGGKARVLANQGWARAFYDEGTINAMISQQGLTAEEVAASVVAPDDRDYLAACFDHCFFGTETATVEVVHVIECLRTPTEPKPEVKVEEEAGRCERVGPRRSSDRFSPTGGLSPSSSTSSSAGSGSGSSLGGGLRAQLRRQPVQCLMQLRAVVEDEYLGFMLALQVLPLRVELPVPRGTLKSGPLISGCTFRSGAQLKNHVLLLEELHEGDGADASEAGGEGQGFATVAAAALGVGGKRRRTRMPGKRAASGALCGAAGRRVKGALAAASGGCSGGMDASTLMPTTPGGGSWLQQPKEGELEPTDECTMVMGELLAATAGDLLHGGHAEDVLSLLDEDDEDTGTNGGDGGRASHVTLSECGDHYTDAGRHSAVTDYDTVVSGRESFYGRDSFYGHDDGGRESFCVRESFYEAEDAWAGRDSFRESSVSAVSCATYATAATGMPPACGASDALLEELYAWDGVHWEHQQAQLRQQLQQHQQAAAPQAMEVEAVQHQHQQPMGGFQHRPPPHPASHQQQQHFFAPAQQQHQHHQQTPQPLAHQHLHHMQPPQQMPQAFGAAVMLAVHVSVPNRDSADSLLTDRESAHSLGAEEEAALHSLGMSVPQTSAELAAAFEKSFEPQRQQQPQQHVHAGFQHQPQQHHQRHAVVAAAPAPAPVAAAVQQKKKNRAPMWSLFHGSWRS